MEQLPRAGVRGGPRFGDVSLSSSAGGVSPMCVSTRMVQPRTPPVLGSDGSRWPLPSVGAVDADPPQHVSTANCWFSPTRCSCPSAEWILRGVDGSALLAVKVRRDLQREQHPARSAASLTPTIGEPGRKSGRFYGPTWALSSAKAPPATLAFELNSSVFRA